MAFWKSKPQKPYYDLIDDVMAEFNPYRDEFKNTQSGQRVLALSPEQQRDFVFAAIDWMKDTFTSSWADSRLWTARKMIQDVLKRRLPLTEEDLKQLIDWSINLESNYWRSIAQIIKATEYFLKDHELTPSLKGKLANLILSLELHSTTVEIRKWVARLKELSGQSDSRVPLVLGEAWSDVASADIGAMQTSQSAWLNLLSVCAKASGSAPAAKWLKTALPLVNEISWDQFRESMLKWFPLVDKPRTKIIAEWSQYSPDRNELIEPINADILRSLVWLCAQKEDKELARALTNLAVSAFRKVIGAGPRCVRVGNACVWALGAMPGNEGLGQLALLKVKVKSPSAQKVIEKALEATATRLGLPRNEIEEISVPTYCLQTVGVGKMEIGDFTAEVKVKGTSTTELKWLKPDGTKQSSVPSVVKEQDAETLKELNQAIKDIRKMVPAQVARIEQLYLERKSWTLPQWRERYLDHPLVGTIARKLMWRFTRGEQTESGMWYDNQIRSSDGRTLDWLDDLATVELWHPLHESTEAVMQWRDFLVDNEIQQPFKQAHREIYLVTDAENATRIYSNRFAAHVIKQYQFNGLCAARGWRNKLRLMVDDSYPPPVRLMPAWDLRAEFWVESIGENFGVDTTESGAFLYLATDQVRFYNVEGPNARNEPLEMKSVPALVFSEIMRDVDLFVGVASVANDPTWSDGGPEGRYQDYWTERSFGALSETAKTRKQVLERLIPRLRIANRCTLTEKFLVVRGDVRTYNIHLGSSNILMEPNDQYLCIVRAPTSSDSGGGKMFLPFEGDNMLSVILSKAFLLAEDWKIKDPTILHQIGV